MTPLKQQSQFFIALSFLLSVALTILTQPVAAQSTNSVVSWGFGSGGSLNAPADLSNVKAIAAGHAHSLALKNDGTVVAWGNNTYRQSNVPVGLSDVTMIAAGKAFSLALKSDGTVVAWGNTTIPAGLSNVKAIAAGESHALALKNDGTVVAWGSNTYGEATVPAALSGVTAIVAGGNYSIALKSKYAIVAWGRNDSGQTNIPTNLSGVATIVAGGSHNLALKNNGTVVAWGSNGEGQANVPAGLSGVTAIAAGLAHSLALKSNGTVVAWGSKSYGQATVPAGLRSVTAIAAGGNQSLAFGNTPPTISAKSLSLATGTSDIVTLALVKDAQEAEELLDVSVNTPPFEIGVLIKGIRVDSNGNVTASVDIACNAITSIFTFILRVTDRSGLFSEAQLTVKVTPNLNTTFTRTPESMSGATAVFNFRGTNECTVSFECKLDGGGWTASTGSQGYSNLTNGTHTFQVRAKDAAGNVDPTPATYTWQVFAASCGTTVLPITLAQPKIGVAYSQNLAATPSGNYTFSLLSGILPPGLQIVQIPLAINPWLSWLTGTPTTRGTYTFAIKAKKTNSSCEGARMYTITVQ